MGVSPPLTEADVAAAESNPSQTTPQSRLGTAITKTEHLIVS